MEQISDAQEATRSLPEWDGSPRAQWSGVRSYHASKTCLHCGEIFRPNRFRQKGKVKDYPEGEKSWSKRETCSPSCAKKYRNPMHSRDSRQKMSETLRKIGHRPKNIGGNGRELTVHQREMLTALGPDWVAEYAIKTKAGHRNGKYPNHYKADLANPKEMIVVELDGNSHCSLERQEQDRKKDNLLTKLGWSVFRVRNEDAEKLYTTYRSADILRILREGY